MPDVMTQLAKEFLEHNSYVVSTDIKMPKRKSQTESDMDILAITNQDKLSRYGLKCRTIVGEVKNFSFKKNHNIDEIYRRKFKHIDNRRHSRERLKKYIPLSKHYDKVVFCRNIKLEAYEYAKRKYDIKVITATQMISHLANQYKEDRKRTYYPEQYNYNTLRIILESLAETTKYKDKLLLNDLVILGSKDTDRSSGKISKFVKQNQDFLERFAFKERHDNIIKNLIRKLYDKYPNSLMRILKENPKLWKKIRSKRK